MKNIRLKTMELQYFKGIRNLTVDFSNVTDISGGNATGKTTLMDAFTWALFGKDSQDRTDFEIKTLDNKGNYIPKVDHSVRLVLDVEGIELTVQRIFREKWVKKRGSVTPVMQGHETVYHWNDAPVSKGEFEGYINQLIDKEVFKMITNPLYFNSVHHDKRREILTILVDDIPWYDLAEGGEELERFVAGMGSMNISIDMYGRQLKAKRKKLSDELKFIPAKIDENQRAIPMSKVDYDKVRDNLRDLELLEKELNKKLTDRIERNKKFREEQYNLQSKIFDKKTELRNYEQELLNKDVEKQLGSVNDRVHIEGQIRILERELKSVHEEISVCENAINHLNERLVEHRENWNRVKKSKLDTEKEGVCPACNRPFDSEQIEGLVMSFDEHKNKTLTEITQSGRTFANKRNEALAFLEEKKKERTKIGDEITSLTAKLVILSDQVKEDFEKPSFDFTQDPKHKDLSAQLEDLESKVVKDVPNDSDIQAQLDTISVEKESAKKILLEEEETKKRQDRIDELCKQEQTLAQELANLEKEEWLLEELLTRKARYMEATINQYFEQVDFRLFEEQINGGLKPVCDAMVDGVPFNALNRAAQLNAGLDIINTLCKIYETTAPIFIDNRESVNDIINTDSQVINLRVSKELSLTL